MVPHEVGCNLLRCDVIIDDVYLVLWRHAAIEYKYLIFIAYICEHEILFVYRL